MSELGRGSRPGGGRTARGARRARGRVDPALFVCGHSKGLIQGDSMSARVMNALGATDLERTICASAGIAGTKMARLLTRGRSRGGHARYVIVWGWNPMSTAPHLWRKLLDALQSGRQDRGGRSLPQPHRARGRRASPAAGHRRGAGPGDDACAIIDAGLQDEEWCRVTPRATTSCWRTWPTSRSSAPPRSRGRGRHDRAGRARVRGTRPALLRLGVGAQRHLGAPAAYATHGVASRSHRRLARSWGRLLLHPQRHRVGGEQGAAARMDLRPGPVRRINMSQVGKALTDPELDPPVAAMVCWNSNPAAVAPISNRCSPAWAARTCSPWCSSSS